MMNFIKRMAGRTGFLGWIQGMGFFSLADSIYWIRVRVFMLWR
jgi:hypothetical protein